MDLYFNTAFYYKKSEATGGRSSWFIGLRFILLQDDFIRKFNPEFETFKSY